VRGAHKNELIGRSKLAHSRVKQKALETLTAARRGVPVVPACAWEDVCVEGCARGVSERSVTAAVFERANGYESKAARIT
jgi:hypothetical protein